MVLASSSSRKILTKNPRTRLTEDLWLEIFVFLPLFSIFKLKCVSKVWSSLLSNPKFINKWIQFNRYNNSLPWVVFHNYETLDISMKFLLSYPKSLGSRFMSGYEHGFTFEFLNPNPDVKNIHLLDSSNGLVLCTGYDNAVRYYVCNPLTQKWVSLPPSPNSTSCVMGFTCDSNSCYKVVRIPKFEANSSKFNVQIFSSDTGEWNVYEVTRPGDVVWYDSYSRNSVVIVNGVLYWPEGKGRILVYDLNNNGDVGTDVQQCRLINFPGQEELESENSYGGSYCLGASEGFLCCARIMESQKSLSVWMLEEGWQLLHKDLDLHDLVAEMFSKLYVCEFEDWEGAEMQIDYEKRENEAIMDVEVLGFNPVDKNIIIISYHFTVWAYNIQTRRHEVLSEPSFLSNTSGNRYKLSDTSFRVRYPFALQPMPTMLPSPVSVSNVE